MKKLLATVAVALASLTGAGHATISAGTCTDISGTTVAYFTQYTGISVQESCTKQYQLLADYQLLANLHQATADVNREIRNNDIFAWFDSKGYSQDLGALALKTAAPFWFEAHLVDDWIAAKVTVKEMLSDRAMESVEYHQGRAWFSDIRSWAANVSYVERRNDAWDAYQAHLRSGTIQN